MHRINWEMVDWNMYDLKVNGVYADPLINNMWTIENFDTAETFTNWEQRYDDNEIQRYQIYYREDYLEIEENSLLQITRHMLLSLIRKYKMPITHIDRKPTIYNLQKAVENIDWYS